MLERYLAAFGPASRRDVAAWSGAAQRDFAEAFERLETVSYRDEKGTELLDLPGRELPPAAIELPVRLLGNWDQALLAYADRERIMTPEVQALKLTLSGDPVVTVGGRVARAGACCAEDSLARVEVTPHVELRRADRAAIREEARYTARVCEPDGDARGGRRGLAVRRSCEHMFVSYAELHCHSAFSFLDGASLPDELAGAAHALGYEAMALTDHNSVSGSMEFAQAAGALGLRAIHGAEVDLDDGRHITLLVETQKGWQNLCRILSRAHAHTRDPREPPPAVPLETVEAARRGAGVPERLRPPGGARRADDAPAARRLRAAKGCAWSCSARSSAMTGRSTAACRRWPRRLGLACVATGNVHAHARSRAPLQDAFVALRHHTTLDASEPVRRGNFAHVLAAPDAMAARFADHPEAVAEAVALADRLRFDLGADLGYRYPGSEDGEAQRKLAELCWAKMDDRYPAGHPCHADAHARLEEELRVIASLGLPGFFLLHRDLLELAREVAVEVRGPDTARALLPPGRGRGSSVSSIVCYLTGLSHIDPVENDLFLGRFLNEELTALPDIDLDFPRDVREVLIPRVHERYGAEKSALVAAFPTFRSRGAIRELGKVLGLPAGELERLARGAEPWAVRGVTHDVEEALGLEHGGPPPAVYDPDPRMGEPFAMTTVGVAGGGQRARSAAGRPPSRGDDRGPLRRASPAAGSGWRGCATRRTACPATSPSTRAG